MNEFDVDAHITEMHDSVVSATTGGPAIPGTPEFCLVVLAAIPILDVVIGLLFFKPKWRTVVIALKAGLEMATNIDLAASARLGAGSPLPPTPIPDDLYQVKEDAAPGEVDVPKEFSNHNNGQV